MGNRHEAREAALGFLYQNELHVKSLTENLPAFMTHFKVLEVHRPFLTQIVQGVQKHQEEIDREIEEAAENWKLYRIAKIDLSILRIATWELLHCQSTDFQVVIDEAVELAKTFGSEESSAFVNGILDHIAQKVRASSQAAI